MVRPTLKKQIPNLQEAIKEMAWKQIAEFGAAALSLRAIARELKITAPAIYNYFPDRDALVTALIVEAFTSFADSQAEALTNFPKDDHAGRLRALGVAYRDWAMTYPERYQLIFGTPIAGYVAPLEITMPAAACGLEILVGVIQAAEAAGRLRVGNQPPLPPEVKSMLREWQSSRATKAPFDVLYLALIVWGQVHGLVLLEIGHQFPPFIADPGAIYRHELERVVRRFVL